jgi:hypothetical protein
LHGFEGLVEFDTAMDEGDDVYLLMGQGDNGLFERAAAGAYDGDFVDDEGGEVEGFASGASAFEDDGSAGADHLEGEFDAGGGAGAIDDDVLVVAGNDVG